MNNQQITVTITLQDSLDQSYFEALVDALKYELHKALDEGASFTGVDSNGNRRDWYVPKLGIQIATQ